jgi:hypothetical protein
MVIFFIMLRGFDSLTQMPIFILYSYLIVQLAYKLTQLTIYQVVKLFDKVVRYITTF